MIRALATCALLLCLTGCLDSPVAVVEGQCSVPPDSASFALDLPNLAGGGRVEGDDSFGLSLDLASVMPEDTRYDCLGAIRVALAWTNTMTAGGDLYIGTTLPGDDTHYVGRDSQQLIADGAHEEFVWAPVRASFNPAGLTEGLPVTIYSSWVSASQSGLPVQVLVQFFA